MTGSQAPLEPATDDPRVFTHPKIEMIPLTRLTPYVNNARTHSRRQIQKIADSIGRFGFVNPVLIADDMTIIAGHGRIEAAKRLGLAQAPALRLSHLSEAERRAYVLADNRLAEEAGWDRDMLAIELEGLIEIDFDVEATGFELAEIDLAIDAARDARAAAADMSDEADRQPLPHDGPPVTRTGDLWRLGPHRLLCGDARSETDMARLTEGEAVDLIFTDPPYNVRIEGNVSGLGAARHRDFAMASGEMDQAAFTAFLEETLGRARAAAKDGAIAFVCMDWRHMREMLDAGEAVFDELKNLCVWNKTNGGMGTFYRSKHELVFVWKIGTAPHVNSFGLGDTGRYRTNVWDYAGVNAPTAERREALAMHPTVKPVQMIADAIRDCSRRGETALDPFGGSGSTLIAAETCGRAARLMEIDPAYCDMILHRWSRFTGKRPLHDETGLDFEALAGRRLGASEEVA